MECLDFDIGEGSAGEVRVEWIEGREGIPAVSLLRRSTSKPWY